MEEKMETSFGTLRCTLLDRRSSVPLAEARIMCAGRDGRVFRFDSDQRGAFAAELPEGVYDLVISARGYLSLMVRGIGILARHHQTITRGLIPGEGKGFEDEPATAIAGYVVDRIGQAVGNLAIHVNEERGRHTYTTRTDRFGVYILHGVIPGMYDLSVRAGVRTVDQRPLPIAHVKELVRLDLRILQL
jgi:hypothetical protein